MYLSEKHVDEKTLLPPHLTCVLAFYAATLSTPPSSLHPSLAASLFSPSLAATFSASRVDERLLPNQALAVLDGLGARGRVRRRVRAVRRPVRVRLVVSGAQPARECGPMEPDKSDGKKSHVSQPEVRAIDGVGCNQTKITGA